jgi:hypothetical protein
VLRQLGKSNFQNASQYSSPWREELFPAFRIGISEHLSGNFWQLNLARLNYPSDEAWKSRMLDLLSCRVGHGSLEDSQDHSPGQMIAKDLGYSF